MDANDKSRERLHKRWNKLKHPIKSNFSGPVGERRRECGTTDKGEESGEDSFDFGGPIHYQSQSEPASPLQYHPVNFQKSASSSSLIRAEETRKREIRKLLPALSIEEINSRPIEKPESEKETSKWTSVTPRGSELETPPQKSEETGPLLPKEEETKKAGSHLVHKKQEFFGAVRKSGDPTRSVVKNAVDLKQKYSSASASLSPTENKTSASAPTSPVGQNGPVPKGLPREGDFEWTKPLGRGSYGEVMLGVVKATKKEFAVKFIEKKKMNDPKMRTKALREKQILGGLKHPNIIALFYTFQGENYLYYVMEYCPNGTVIQMLEKFRTFSMECTIFYTAEIVSALEHLHSINVVHRDLKPENMLLDKNYHLKLIDFGSAKIINQARERTESFEGSIQYISPELLKNDPTGKSSDLWSLGICIYEFLTGRPPFRSMTTGGTQEYYEFKAFQSIISLSYVFPLYYPADAKHLTQSLLEPNPEKRIGSENFADLKSHPFFEEIDWKNLHTTTPPRFSSFISDMCF